MKLRHPRTSTNVFSTPAKQIYAPLHVLDVVKVTFELEEYVATCVGIQIVRTRRKPAFRVRNSAKRDRSNASAKDCKIES